MSKKRWYQIYNIKAFLICCVVMGHLCEVVSFPGKHFLYILIYSFHMPAFAFLSGAVLCRGREKALITIAQKYLYPYIVFQILYVLFSKSILHAEVKLQFFKPYWLLWYLMAMIAWHIAVNVFKADSQNKKYINLSLSIIVSLLVGYVNNISYFLSLSRIIVFFPFFLAGYYFNDFIKSFFWNANFDNYKILGKIRIISFFAVIFSLILFFYFRDNIQEAWLYNSYPYYVKDYNWQIRFWFQIIATVIIVFLCTFAPPQEIPLITYIGQNTMPVYLLHGFVIKFVVANKYLVSTTYPVLWTLFSMIFIVVIFSSKLAEHILYPLMQYPFKTKKKNSEKQEQLLNI